MRDATTPPRAGEVSVGRRGDIHRRDLHPLRYYTPSALRARPPKRGTVMDTTSLKLGNSYAECKADAPWCIPTIGLYLPKERSDYLLLTPSISHEQTRAQHATSLLVGVHRFFVSLKDDTEKKNLRHPRHLRLKNARKFSVTHWKSVEAELSDDEFQLQVPIYKRY